MLTQWLEIKARGCCRHVFLVSKVLIVTSIVTTFIYYYICAFMDVEKEREALCLQSSQVSEFLFYFLVLNYKHQRANVLFDT